MRRTAFAIAVAALIFASFSGVSHATLISPLPAGFVSEAVSGHLTQVWWRGGWRGYGWRGYLGPMAGVATAGVATAGAVMAGAEAGAVDIPIAADGDSVFLPTRR